MRECMFRHMFKWPSMTSECIFLIVTVILPMLFHCTVIRCHYVSQNINRCKDKKERKKIERFNWRTEGKQNMD